MHNIAPVILCGGSGTRLWPLSRAGSPKFLHDLTGAGRSLLQATADRLGVDFEDWKAAVSREIPVGRVGTPDDIAAVAAFLCGEDAGYVSGQVIYVAGGPRA